jgi:pimeloyl-ACP methyl ester carboxylesterase
LTRQLKVTESEKHNDPLLLLLHGFFGNAHNWRACVETLSRRWKVFAPQLPFFGLSHRRDRMDYLMQYLSDLIAAHQLNRIVIVGNSLGGQLAVTLALRESQRIAGLVLTGSSGLYERNLTGKIQRRPQREWVRDRIREIFYDARHVTDVQVDEIMGLLYDRRKALDILLLAKSIRNDSLRESLPQVACPVSLVWGADDQITPPDTAREFQNLLPDADLHLIPECGHAAMMEQPEIFNRLVEDFLQRLVEKETAAALRI